MGSLGSILFIKHFQNIWLYPRNNPIRQVEMRIILSFRWENRYSIAVLFDEGPSSGK